MLAPTLLLEVVDDLVLVVELYLLQVLLLQDVLLQLVVVLDVKVLVVTHVAEVLLGQVDVKVLHVVFVFYTLFLDFITVFMVPILYFINSFRNFSVLSGKKYLEIR